MLTLAASTEANDAQKNTHPHSGHSRDHKGSLDPVEAQVHEMHALAAIPEEPATQKDRQGASQQNGIQQNESMREGQREKKGAAVLALCVLLLLPSLHAVDLLLNWIQTPVD